MKILGKQDWLQVLAWNENTIRVVVGDENADPYDCLIDLSLKSATDLANKILDMVAGTHAGHWEDDQLARDINEDLLVELAPDDLVDIS